MWHVVKMHREVVPNDGETTGCSKDVHLAEQRGRPVTAVKPAVREASDSSNQDRSRYHFGLGWPG